MLIVRAGFTGLYMLHKLRECGFSPKVVEAGSGVGERGSGTAIPARGVTFPASNIPAASRPSWSANGDGPNATHPRRKSCAISNTSPTGST